MTSPNALLCPAKAGAPACQETPDQKKLVRGRCIALHFGAQQVHHAPLQVRLGYHLVTINIGVAEGACVWSLIYGGAALLWASCAYST